MTCWENESRRIRHSASEGGVSHGHSDGRDGNTTIERYIHGIRRRGASHRKVMHWERAFVRESIAGSYSALNGIYEMHAGTCTW